MGQKTVQTDKGGGGTYPVANVNKADGRYLAKLALKPNKPGEATLWFRVLSGSTDAINTCINANTPGSGGNAPVWASDNYTPDMYVQGTPDPSVYMDDYHKSPNCNTLKAAMAAAAGGSTAGEG